MRDISGRVVACKMKIRLRLRCVLCLGLELAHLQWKGSGTAMVTGGGMRDVLSDLQCMQCLETTTEASICSGGSSVRLYACAEL